MFVLRGFILAHLSSHLPCAHETVQFKFIFTVNYFIHIIERGLEILFLCNEFGRRLHNKEKWLQWFWTPPVDSCFSFFTVIRCNQVMLCCWQKKGRKKTKQVLRDTAPQRGLWIIFCLNWVTISEDATRWRALRMFDVEIVPLFFPFPPFQDGMRFWAHWRGHQQAPVGGDTKSLSKARWLHEEWAVMSSGLGLIPAASLGFSSSADASRESLALSAAFFLSFLPTTLFL